MYHLQSRYYNSEWGRFINTDEYIGQVGTLPSGNMFAYCLNNSLNLHDPSGSDSSGKLISTTGTLASTVGAKNPYRYRGYRYDTETGLYYLQSRYYSPDWGRFINADAYGGKVGDLLTHNVFAYCMNNPINFQDPSGNWRILSDVWQGIKNIVNAVEQHIVATVVTAVVVVAAVVAINYVMRSPRALPATTSGGAVTSKIASKATKVSEGTGKAKSIPGRGYHKEVYANKPVKVKDAVDKWDEFLGPGEHTNIHPRTRLEDPDRIFSADGIRSIRFGSHEMNSNPNKFHYHEEIWTFDPIKNVMNVDNTVVRVPYK